MNRRSFFRRALPSAIVGAAAAPAIVEAISADLPDVVTRDGIEARWLGWSKSVDLYSLWGVWQFTLADGRMCYSTTAGVLSRNHHRGNVFDMRLMNSTLTMASSEDDKRAARTVAYDRGIADAIAWRDEPAPKEPDYKFGFTGFATGPKLTGGRFPNS